MSYEPSWLYEGGFQFKKHYFGPKPGELLEKTPSGKLKEEFQCAQFLDGLPEVKFWVRNLANKATSFRLQTSKIGFIPISCASSTMAACSSSEYKGEHLFAEAEEKRAVGAVWESRSAGKCTAPVS
jgi:type III restriction enzyme